MISKREFAVYLRVAQEEANRDPKPRRKRERQANPNLVLFFDCETTRDQRQELIFGTCQIYSGGNLVKTVIFTGDRDESELKTAHDWAIDHGFEVMTVEDFISNTFYPYALQQKAVVAGFNLPFDLSRIAAEFEPTKRLKGKKNWTLCLLPREDGRFSRTPRISVERLDSTKAFIKFTRAKEWKHYYPGAFVDLRTLVFALTGKKHTLESAAEDFGCKFEKTNLPECSKITRDFLEYGLNDVRLTAELYYAALQRYQQFGLPGPPWRVYSSASLAKAAWQLRGIEPPKLPPEYEGRIMGAFYAGKVENRFVATPIEDVHVLDFTSQYPSLWILLGMERLLTAKELVPRQATKEVIDWLEGLTREDLKDPDTWKDPRMMALCEVELRGATVPVRSTFGKPGTAPTIGWSPTTTEEGLTMPYFVADLAAAKLLDGEIKFTVKKATIFEPRGKQHVKAIKILGVHIGKDNDVIQTMAEARMDEKALGEARSDGREKGLKTITNSGAYGIFVEVNRQETGNDVLIHGIQDEPFLSDATEFEAPGKAYCPLLGAVITSAAHLLLAMAERATEEAGGKVVYCDTDSIFVTPASAVQAVTSAFESLNPYSRDVPFLKDETEKKCPPAEAKYGPGGVIFYGLSSKRYCLFTRNGDEIHVYRDGASDHGLGGFKAPGDRKDFIRGVWADIVRDPSRAPDLYTGMPAIGDFNLSSPALLSRTKRLGKIRPFSFMTARILEPGKASEDRSELIPFKSKLTAQDQEELMRAPRQRTWSSVVEAFVRHRDRKFMINEDGSVERFHVYVKQSNIYGLGKETHHFEAAQILGLAAVGGHAQVHVDLKRRIRALTKRDAEVMDIPWETVRRWKARARKGLALENGHGSKAKDDLIEGLARLHAVPATAQNA